MVKLQLTVVVFKIFILTENKGCFFIENQFRNIACKYILSS